MVTFTNSQAHNNFDNMSLKLKAQGRLSFLVSLFRLYLLYNFQYTIKLNSNELSKSSIMQSKGGGAKKIII